MPHGAGHIGGGHHHGGGGGGGFHHHHHHHHVGGGGFRHHHNHHYGYNRGWYQWGSGPYYYGYRRSAWTVVVLFVIVVTVVLSVSLSFHYSSNSNDLDTVKEYALTDKVICSYNGYFCQGLEAQSTDAPVGNFQSNATLYLLSSPPPLTDSEHFSFSEIASLDSITNYHFWNFYLNTGSQVSLNVCYPIDTRNGNHMAKFYLIRGTKNYNKWTDDQDQSHAVKYTRLLSNCQTIAYQVPQDGLYYFVFYLDTSFLSLSTTIKVSFDFDRTVYHVSPDSVVQNCSIPLDGYSSCSISVPMSSGYTALLSLNTSLPVDYGDGANVKVNCQPRSWFYAVVILSALLPVVVIIAIVVTCIYIRVRRGKKNRYSLLNQTNTIVNTNASGNSRQASGTNDSTTFANSSGPEIKPPTSNPPAYNPSYSPAASGTYGALTQPAPPPYTK